MATAAAPEVSPEGEPTARRAQQTDVDPTTHPVRRRARRSRFLVILVGITLGMHVPVALGVTELARRLGIPLPWLVGLAVVLKLTGRNDEAAHLFNRALAIDSGRWAAV